MAIKDSANTNPFIKSFMDYLEEEVKKETIKIMDNYKEIMIADLDAVRATVVAKASVRLSDMMTIQDLGRTIRIEIIKREEPNHG